MIALVAFQEVRPSDVGSGRIDARPDNPRDEEIRQGHDDAKDRQKSN
jgi:hypothetical protein